MVLKGEKEKRRPVLALFILVLAAMMLAHTVSSFILLLTIFLLSLSVLFTSRLIPRSLTDYRSIGIPFILLASTAVLAYWMLFSNFLTERVDSLLRSFGSAHLLALSPIGKTYIAYEVDNIGLYLFYAFGIIGLLASMRKSKLGPTRLGLSAMALLFLISNRVYERPTDIPFSGTAIMVGRAFAERLALFNRVYSNAEVVAYYD